MDTLSFMGFVFGNSGGEAGSPSAIPSFPAEADTSTTTPPPAAGGVIWNNATQASATVIHVSGTSSEGENIQQLLLEYPRVQDVIIIRDTEDSTIYQKWEITSITDNTTYVSYGVTLIEDNGGNISDGAALAFGFDLKFNDNAFHKTLSNEFNGLTLKATPVGADILAIESAADSFAKRGISIDSLPFLSNPLTADLDTDGFNIINSNSNGNIQFIAGDNVDMGNYIYQDPTSLNTLSITRASGVWNIFSDGAAGGRTITINNNFATGGSINLQMGTGGSLTMQRVGSAYAWTPNGGLTGNIDLGASPSQDFRNLWINNEIRDTGGLNELEIVVDATAGGIYRKKLALDDVSNFNQAKLVFNASNFGDYITNQQDVEYFIPRSTTSSAQTSGPLVVGAVYRINSYVAGDDFTNVGGTNAFGDIFKATGTTPTTWTNSSSLQRQGQNFPVDTEISGAIEYPFLAEFVEDTDVTVNNRASSSKFITWKLKKVATDEWDLEGSVPEFFELKFSGGEAKGNFPVAVSGVDFKGTDNYPPIYTSEATIVAYSEDGDDCDAEIEDITNTNTICSTADFTNTNPETIDMGTVSNLPTSAAVFELQGGNDDKKKSAIFYEARFTFNKPE